MSETRIYNDILYLNPNIPNNNFEFAPTPLSAGGVGMYIEVTMNNSVIEGTSNEAFQALWGELQFAKQSNIIWGVIYRATEFCGTFFRLMILKLLSFR